MFVNEDRRMAERRPDRKVTQATMVLESEAEIKPSAKKRKAEAGHGLTHDY